MSAPHIATLPPAEQRLIRALLAAEERYRARQAERPEERKAA